MLVRNEENMAMGTSICHYAGYDLLLGLNLFNGGAQQRLD